MTVFAFDVYGSTHDLLKQGVTEPYRHRVIVAADNRDEAALVACQMVACRGQIPTLCLDRI